MMLHQDGSSHEWVPGRWWDLIVTMDDATSDIYSAFFVAEEGTMSSFQGVSEAIRGQGLCSARSTPTAPAMYWNTPEAVRQGGQGHPDPGRPRPGAARHRVDPGLLARGKGALGAYVRHFLAEAPAPILWNSGSSRHHRHESRPTAFLKEAIFGCHNTTPLSRPRPRTGASPARTTDASTRNAPSQTTTRCATISAPLRNCWHFRSPPAATAAITSRPGSASTNTPTAQWPSSMAMSGAI